MNGAREQNPTLVGILYGVVVIQMLCMAGADVLGTNSAGYG